MERQFDKQFIGGKWKQGNDLDHVNEDKNPYTQETIITIQGANTQDVDEAYQAAQKAQKEWIAKTPQERRQVIKKAADLIEEQQAEIMEWLVKEGGATKIKAGLEINLAKGITEEAASFPLRIESRILPTSTGEESFVMRRPVGVVGIISPWNFPFHLTMRSLAPALAAGNGVVIKPASDSPVTGGLLPAKIFEAAGVPKGLVNVTIGSGSEIGDYFVSHPIPTFISFTGSTPVGKNIASHALSGKRIKQVALELGGNSPFIVLADADLDEAAHALVVSKFMHSGQICMAANRAIVVEAVFDAFVEKVVERVKKLVVGDPADKQTIIGPIINQKQTDHIEEIIQQARSSKAKFLIEGTIKEQIVEPFVLVSEDPALAVFHEEIFGPVLPILKVKDTAAAIAAANDTDYGLSSALFTRDLTHGRMLANELESGMCHINGLTVADEPSAPFGGEKNSGIGRFNGEWVLEEFTRVQWVTTKTGKNQYPF
ncbi:aldehyde dehydrogenase family protein [Enterococcus xiangfangensis]|uniref:Aldehyde dehydrogenase family protein n=1 Tax=Enterococcus xiangfangensis TaxID=1296537 RepID=A0ABU3FDQ6_9ENTE|nr:aldehyde dehydrogenase family protein [Enterococcus xiangfangensis]MDT2760521.1 aldehyde dehydrogenase family protein [Enterococcus xiangfangensis]